MKTAEAKDTVNLIVAGEVVLHNLSVSVTLDDHSIVELKNIETVKDENLSEDCIETLYRFSDEEGTVLLTLRLKSYHDIILSFVDVHIKNERMQSRHKYLAPEGSISIHVESLGAIDGLMANYQHKDWWTRPHFSTNLSLLPERTQSLLWKREDLYYYLLPVVDKVYRTELAGSKEGFDVKLSSYAGGYDQCHTLTFAIGKSKKPFGLAKATIAKVLEALGFPTQLRENKRYPHVLDYLGWCSWDAFYHQVSENGIIEKMEELKEKKLPVKWTMIDDGWLDVKENQLLSFKADREKFPNGLLGISTKLKQQYGVTWVGVWHTIAGYWGGVHSELAGQLRDSLFETNSKKFIPHYKMDKGFKFWNQWHSELKQQGIDFVKVDSQSAINNFMLYQKSVGEASRGIHKGLEASVGIHFDQCIINCMGMAAENIFNRPISAVSRNSDDFVPGNEISFKEHALQNAYNSYYHGEFYWGDWDMFWTNHEEDIQNAVLRAVSGGPVYFSDKVGETDPEKVWPLILNNGRILRADRPGLPTEDCLLKNPNEEPVPLKVWNTVNGAGVVAAFNIHLKGERVQGVLRPSDVPTLKGDKFAFFDYFKQKVTLIDKESIIPLSLEKDTAKFYIILPLDPMNKITPIGLVNKYMAPATVQEIYGNGKSSFVRLTEGGIFGFISNDAPKAAYINGMETDVNAVNGPYYTIDCSDRNSEEVLVELSFK
jgi:raffinose synthase